MKTIDHFAHLLAILLCFMAITVFPSMITSDSSAVSRSAAGPLSEDKDHCLIALENAKMRIYLLELENSVLRDQYSEVIMDCVAGKGSHNITGASLNPGNADVLYSTSSYVY